MGERFTFKGTANWLSLNPGDRCPESMFSNASSIETTGMYILFVCGLKSGSPPENICAVLFWKTRLKANTQTDLIIILFDYLADNELCKSRIIVTWVIMWVLFIQFKELL